MRLLCSKHGIFFTSLVPANGAYSLYKMSEEALSGKSAPEEEMGALERHVAPGNVFARKLSSTGWDSPRMGSRKRMSAAPDEAVAASS